MAKPKKSKSEPVAAEIGPDHHIYLIDGSGFIFRAYHALPSLTRKSDGLPIGAVSGFCNMLWKMLEGMTGDDRPTHLAVIFDKGSTSFRNEIYDQYKAQRPEPPEDLRPQFALIRDATRAFGLPCIEVENYEADDLIATYARQATEAGARSHHRLVRQGSDATRERPRRDVRPDEGQAHSRTGSRREIRRAA